MNSGESKPRELSPEEIATALDWIDGELAQEDAVGFELRLSQDKDLARQVEGLAGLDTFMRRAARERSGMSMTRRRWVTWAVLAAAALILAVFLPRIFEPRAARFEVALAPSFALAEDWVNQQPGLEGASAPGIAVSRGAKSEPMTAADFLRASTVLEASVAASALGQKRHELEAGWFVIPIDLEEAASVIVLSFAENTATARLFPSTENKDASLDAGPHLLPSARVVQGRTADMLEYRPGFLVPLGVKELTLLVGVRAQSSTALPLEEIDAWLASAKSADQVTARLAKLGFTVQRLSVREPK